jgi:hypothetical protein
MTLCGASAILIHNMHVGRPVHALLNTAHLVDDVAAVEAPKSVVGKEKQDLNG